MTDSLLTLAATLTGDTESQVDRWASYPPWSGDSPFDPQPPWKDFIPEPMQHAWGNLSKGERLAAFVVAFAAANKGEWQASTTAAGEQTWKRGRA